MILQLRTQWIRSWSEWCCLKVAEVFTTCSYPEWRVRREQVVLSPLAVCSDLRVEVKWALRTLVLLTCGVVLVRSCHLIFFCFVYLFCFLFFIRVVAPVACVWGARCSRAQFHVGRTACADSSRSLDIAAQKWSAQWRKYGGLTDRVRQIRWNCKYVCVVLSL